MLERTYLNIKKVVYYKPTENIILNGDSFEVISLKSGTRQPCPPSPLLFIIVRKVLTKAIRQERKIKGTQIGKEVLIYKIKK